MKNLIPIFIIAFSSISCFGQVYNKDLLINQLNHSTVQIIVEKIKEVTADGKIRKTRGRGTGFFMDLDILEKQMGYLVTNKHVIKDSYRIILVFTEKKDGNPVFGNKIEIDLGKHSNLWVTHKDPNIDLAVMPLPVLLKVANEQGKENIYIKTIPTSFVADSTDWSTLTPMSDVIMVGYPMGIIDDVNNTPLFRSGVISTSPQLDFNGKQDFVVDIASFRGSSGSPIFMYKDNLKITKDRLFMEREIKLIGVLYQGVFQDNLTSEIFYDSNIWKDESKSATPLNLGVVIKISALTDWKM